MVEAVEIHPLSEFGRDAESLVSRVKQAGRPVVLTVEGRAEVVLQDAASYQAMVDRLRELGYPVDVANDGPSALELARRVRPEVVFIDLRMPGMDGVEVAEQLKADGLATHVVAATAYRSELERQRTAAAGFAAHLLKPIDQQSLEQLLTKLH